MITVPTPVTFIEWLWFGMGITFGRGFGKNLDHTIQKTKWFRKLKPWQKWFIRRLLDVTHHWWIGGILIGYFPNIPELFWFGAGLLVDDLPDVPRRIKKLLKVV